MNDALILQQTAEYVKGEFSGDSSGHDWWHIYRVWKTAISICEREGGRLFVVQLAALLHDLDDWKLHPSGSSEPERAMAWMRKLAVDEPVLDKRMCIVPPAPGLSVVSLCTPSSNQLKPLLLRKYMREVCTPMP